MCRLYGMRSNAPTRVECSLVNAQNALMRQSRKDMEGLVHGHGWGVADYRDGLPLVERQTWAAFEGEHFAKAAARLYGHTVIAHVRRATVGEPSIENTHPFGHGSWIFAHNGTIPNFPEVRDRMIPEIDPMFMNDIRGTTDSEHMFYYILSLHYRNPTVSLRRLVGKALSNITEWSAEAAPDKQVGLNVILTDGKFFVGSRLGRTLYHLTRESAFVCPICGKSHVHGEPGADYRVVEIASEPITAENWQEFPDGTVFSVDEFYYLDAESIAGCASETLA